MSPISLDDLTPEQLQRLQARMAELRGGAAAAQGIPRRPGTGPAPLSFAQRQIWLQHQVDPGTLFNVPLALRLTGELDPALIRRVLDEIVRRHELLRTTFQLCDEGPMQVVGPADAGARFAVADLSGAADPAAEALRLARVEADTPFDLAVDPPFRTLLLRLGTREHVLCTTLHHVAQDRWSSGLLMGELAALYRSFAAGAPSPLPEPRIQYADFAVWQLERLGGDALDPLLAFWKEHLEGAPPSPSPAPDHPRGSRPLRPVQLPVHIPPEDVEALRRVAREESGTLFTVLLAAYLVFLRGWTGEDDLVVGTYVANRTRTETERLVGSLANTLALRFRLGEGGSFRDLLRQVRATVLAAQGHQELPFERLVEELQPVREPGRTPLIRTAFNVPRAAPAVLELPGVHGEILPVVGGGAGVDLHWALEDWDDGVVGALEYDAGLYLPETAERMAAAYLRLLDAVSADPDAPLDALDLLGPGERARVLHAWNDTRRDLPAGECVHHLFAAAAARTPDAVAVDSAAGPLTYAELDRASSDLARRLAARGVGPDVRVGLCLERSPELMVALLAVLRAGGAYVPLDPAYPAGRLAFMLRDSAARVLLTREGLAGRFGDFGGEVVVLEVASARPHPAALEPPPSPTSGGGASPRKPAVQSDGVSPEALTPLPPLPMLGEGEHGAVEGEDRSVEMPLPRNGGGWRARGEPGGGVLPDNLAYVIYTSGSTGTPKGVALPHRALVNLLRWQAGEWRHPGASTTLQFTTVSFDVSFQEIFSCWLSGGRLVLLDEEERRDLGAVLERLERAKVERLFLPYVALQHLAEQGVERGVYPSALREVQTAGEQLRVTEAIRRWLGGTGATLSNQYGPSETHVATAHSLEGAPEEWPLLPPIGRPVANARCYVLDARGEPAPVGVPGELYLGGACLARGYLGRPELTAERFVPDPLAGESGVRAYRTGDRARWLASGELEFLGRADQQVKVRGFRIEPGEIEAVLERHPAVREAVAVVREDRLVGYVVGEAVTAEELRAHVGDRLPEYMVPSAVVVLDAFPLTPSGKIDRLSLPVPEQAADEDAYAAPGTPTQEIVAGIFAEVLGVEGIGAGDDFFALGGHSLLATRVVSRVRSVLGVELPVREMFEEPTVAGLAARVDALRSDGAGIAAPPLVPVPRNGPLPASFAQRRLWLIDRMEPGSAAYNLPAALRLRGALDVRALERALGETVRRHEALRTTFAEVGGEPVQTVHEPAPAAVPVADLRHLPAEAREREALRLATEEALRPFDLAAGPLLRAALLRLDGEEWALLFTMHHAVSDGWSIGVLVREVSALYAGEPLPPLPVQYADFAAWQRAWLSGEALDERVAWWRGRLAGAPPLLELPADRPRPPTQGGAGGAVAFTVPAETERALRSLARREGATLFMALLAGWQLLLARWSGQDEVLVGTPVAGRTRVETEGLIGFFVNTLVLRAELSGEPSFRGLLAQVRETTLGAYHHQEVPFEKLVEELAPERSLGHAPLFQVMFALQNTDTGDLRLGELEVEALGAVDPPAKFDLSLELAEAAGELRGTLHYRSELWERATVERMLGQLGTLLASVAADPDRPALEAPILGASERAQLLEEWNATGRAFPSGLRVHDLFAAQARRTPGAPALSHRGEAVTYAELDHQSARLANALRRRGVGPETRVGICMGRTPELVAAMLGVLRAGGAYVPLDPAYPRERLGWMLEDARVSLVLTGPGLADRLPESTPLLFADAASGEPDVAPESGVLPGNLSHVIFTSGSTGRPKGVMIRHASTVVLLHWLRESVTDEERSSVLFSTSVSFDVSVAEVFGTLSWGGKLVLVENALELARVEEPVVYASMVPTAAAELLRTGGIPASVRTLNLGGEALPNPLAQALYALGTVERVGNLYGPTEDTTYSTYSAVEREAERVRVGRPVANTRAYVLDARLQPVPVGVVGELYLAGDGLARGYANRPDLTAERFLPDPFGAAGSRMYRVQDRVRWTAGGELEYFGRTDFQVKVRGFRIEPGEIEDVLGGHPSVRDAVALVREDRPGDRRIVVYVTGADVSAAELRAHAAAHLPEYMVPSAVVVLDRFPLTPGGKTDRRALPAPEAPAGEAYRAPRTPTEEIVAGIWAEVLGTGRVGAHDDFFELGGHSLLAARVASRVREALGVEPPLRALFEAPTVQALAARVDALLAGGEREEAPPLVPVPRDGPLPLSFAQRRLWLVDRLQPGSPAYNMPFALRLRGGLEPALLERALAVVVRRHEALRTVFATVDGEPVQVVLEAVPVAVLTADLRGLPDPGAEALRRAEEEALRPFDLAAGPLLRSTLLRLADDEWALLFTLHHAVGDGWSMELLVREVSEAYGALMEGREPRLPHLPVQYADYAVWQRSWLTGEVLERQLGWWRERLAGAPPLLELPTDRPRPTVQGPRGGSVPLVLAPEVAAALRSLARSAGATPFMALLAAWQLLLGRYAGQADVVVGTPVAGRTRVETEPLIGFFVNTLALRGDLSGGPGFREVLGRVREATLGAFGHQDVPFERLVEELAPERSLAHSPLFQVVFSLQSAGGGALRLGGVEAEPLGAAGATVRFDLSLSLADDGERIAGALAFRAELFDAATAERVLGHYAALLEAVAADPDRPVATVDFLPPAERARVLLEWNRTATPFPEDRCVHQLFEAQAARTPDAPAVVFRDRSLTYAALDRRADELAGRLRATGVGVDGRVGILLERSEALVVAVLGILKAGAAYVALDPTYPDERLRFVLEDAGASAVVTAEGLAERVGGFGGVVVMVAPAGSEGPHPAALEPPPSPTSGGGASPRNPAVQSDGVGPEALTPLPPLPILGEGEHDGVEGEDRSVEMPLPRNGGGWRARGEPGGGAVSPDNLAYVVYTSGSTGTPKGVLVTHRGVVNYLSWFDREVLGGEGFELPLVSRLSFDAHVRQLFPPLLRGETVRVLPEETVTDPGALLAELSGRGRTSFGGVPSLWSAMVERVRSGEAPRPEGVKAVLLGGEALSDELVERTRALFPDAEVWNHYGPTEATVNTTAARVDGAERVDIGRPIANVRVYLLDVNGGPVPVGVPGELYVGGAGVARGYLGRPELTAERFVPDPFAGEPGARMYRSGDRVRWLAQGRLEYAGRVDEQVKVRGFRVEPGEIEAVLERHPAVREAVVVVREERLLGYVVAESGAVASPPELRDHLAERLPEYMVPSAVVVLETLPLTPNGKVDRRALPAPELAPDGAGHAAPRTPAEEIVAGAFAEVLRAERVGVDQDFFALGGHSLLATRVVARIRSALGVELPLRALFEAPTAAGVAERVDTLLREGAGVAAPPLVPTPRDGALPLSFAQQRLWLIDRLQPGSAAYNVPAALRVRGALDVAALERSLAEVVRRHETLRTVFGETDGEPVQTVREPAPVRIAVTDLRAFPEDRRDGEARRLAAAEAARPFDLGEGPLLRAALLRLDEEEWALLFTLHHVVSDGWSTGVLVAEVSELYTALTEGREPVLPSLPVQYADYAVWQREWLSGGVLDRQLGWWRDRLAGAPPLLELPTDRPRPRVQGARGGRVAFELPPETSRGLRVLSRAGGATLFMTLLAAWQLLLARWAGTEDVSVGTPIAGRGRVETEPLIGFFVNTLVLRTEPEGSLSFRGLLERVRETTLGAYQHQEIPFERLVEELAPQRTLAHTPLFQVMLALQNNERGELRMGGLEVEPLDAGGEGAAKFDLTLAMGEDGERLGGTLSYRAELWDAATVERMTGHFRVLLEAAAAGPDARCDHLPLLTAAERRALTESRDDTAEPYPAGATLHGLVSARAAAHPDAVAVVAAGGGEAVTFGGLEARAGRLAGRLRRLGVGPDVRVAVLMERVPETVVALLAVLGAGGAYVPLDPSYPAARLGFMLEDSGAAVLLSHRGLAERLPPHAAAVVELDGEGFGGAGGAGDAPEVAVSPDNLAYVVYTSGSTGTPKGVAVPHRAVVNYLEWARRAYLPGGGAGAPVHSPLAFDLTVTSLWGPLAAGERVVLAPETEPVEALAAVLRAQGGFGVVKLTPAHLELLAGQLTPEEAARCARLFVVGGEALPAETVAAWARLAPGIGIVNEYGPTETTVGCAVHRARPEGYPSGSVPIGRAIANTRLYVLDPAGEPSPVGVPGELYVAGAGVARGYLGRAELTAERFVPDPFPAEPGARAYRTGDRVRRLPDGELDFLGRMDEQVKVRGFRVEPGEVEAVLAAHPGVRDAAVAVREDATGERRLVGFFVAREGGADAAELRGWLRERLPEHMVPAALVPLDALPLTPNGKTDRRALPAGAGVERRGYVAPRTPAEERVARIWEEVLGVERVGAEDDFFALGGHSLRATRVVSRVRDAMGVEVPLRALFAEPTLAAFAAEVVRAAESAAPAPAPMVTQGNVEEVLAGVDGLSEEEMDRLLEQLSAEEELGW